MKIKLIIFCIIAVSMVINDAEAVDNNVHFSGALVSEPCILPDADTEISLDFGSVISKYLYEYQRTKSVEFSINLAGCNPSIKNTVGVTFNGNEQPDMPGYLSLDSSSQAKGVAIGLESPEGVFFSNNKSTPFYPLVNGDNALKFKAFIQILPDALAKHSLIEGEFTAISTFILNYQ
ncbi:fimbrial protein [Cronobacter sakazakii]|uniref:fimbrial protein n=1 Tax=Cronobacter sakazakii TaxID=28141 RepID=UPI001F3338D9|nr:fimbrial protein [Cronobacter sakazakii]